MPPPAQPAESVERALCVLAHPDDVDFGSAGTIAGWTNAGTEVTYCIVTDGDAGGFDETPREQMPVLRRAEQRAAAAEVGVTDVRFLGYPDGRLELSELNGAPAVVAWTDDGPFMALQLVLADGLVEQVLYVANPDKLAGLALG